MEKIPQQPTKEELEAKFGGDSNEYPKEITAVQRELSEQWVAHNEWCAENGLDPKDNEFFTDGHRYWNDRKEADYAGNHIAGKYKGKKIFVNPGEDRGPDINYNHAWEPEVPVIDIEGEEKLRGKKIYHEKAKEIFDHLAPHIAYDMRKIRWANEQLEQEDKWEKGRPKREAEEKTRQESRERQVQGRQAVLSILGVDASASQEEINQELGSFVKRIETVEFPEKYSYGGELKHDKIGKIQAILDTLNKKREELLKALGDNLSNLELTTSEKIFPSTYSHHRASQNWSTIGPRAWDEYDVTQKIIEVNGKINGENVSFEATKEFITTERDYTKTNENIIAEFVEELAKYPKPTLSDGGAKVRIEDGGLKEFHLVEISRYSDNSAAYESRMIFEILFHLADYSEVLELQIEKIKVEQEKAEEKRKTYAKEQEEKQKKEQDTVKRANDFFGEK